MELDQELFDKGEEYRNVPQTIWKTSSQRILDIKYGQERTSRIVVTHLGYSNNKN